MLVLSLVTSFWVLFGLGRCDPPGCDKPACAAKCADKGSYSWACHCPGSNAASTELTCKEECSCGGKDGVKTRHPRAAPQQALADTASNCDAEACKRKCSGSFKWECDHSGVDKCECVAIQTVVTPEVLQSTAGASCNKRLCKEKCGGSYRWRCINAVDSCTCLGAKDAAAIASQSEAAASLSNAAQLPQVPETCNAEACKAKCKGPFRWTCDNGVENCDCGHRPYASNTTSFGGFACVGEIDCRRNCHNQFHYSCQNGVEMCVCGNSRRRKLLA